MTTTSNQTASAVDRPTGRSVNRMRNGIFATLAVLFGLAVGSTGHWVATRGRLEVFNRLAGPVTVLLPGSPPLRIEPGTSRLVRVRSGKPGTLAWSTVQPAVQQDVAEFDAFGAIEGKLTVPAVGSQLRSTSVELTLASWKASQGDFSPASPTVIAPLITNATADSLEIDLLVGASGEGVQSLPCKCKIPPRMTRVFIGYFPVADNFKIRAKTADGRSATFDNLSVSQADAVSGTIAVKFVQANLRRPTGPDPIEAAKELTAKEAACRRAGGIVMDVGGGRWECDHMSPPPR